MMNFYLAFVTFIILVGFLNTQKEQVTTPFMEFREPVSAKNILHNDYYIPLNIDYDTSGEDVSSDIILVEFLNTQKVQVNTPFMEFGEPVSARNILHNDYYIPLNSDYDTSGEDVSSDKFTDSDGESLLRGILQKQPFVEKGDRVYSFQKPLFMTILSLKKSNAVKSKRSLWNHFRNERSTTKHYNIFFWDPTFQDYDLAPMTVATKSEHYSYKDESQLKPCVYPENIDNGYLFCVGSDDNVTCSETCIFGHILSDRTHERSMICYKDENVWTRKFEDCKPFVDCDLIRQPGSKVWCKYHRKKGPSCIIACSHFEDKPAVEAARYECDIHGDWYPALPSCVKSGSSKRMAAPPLGVRIHRG